MISIAIVDDNRNISSTLSEKLSRFGEFTVMFTAENGKVFLEQMKEAHKYKLPDVVLMDIDMPVMNGIDAVKEAKLRYPLVKYMMLTIFDEDDKIFNAIKIGADAYLLKDEPIEKIRESIVDLLDHRGAPMSPGIARKVLKLLSSSPLEKTGQPNEKSKEDLDSYQLTEREKEILLLLVDGLEYKEIASNLSISPNTVRNLVTKIYSKLHVTSRMQAVNVVRNSQSNN